MRIKILILLLTLFGCLYAQEDYSDYLNNALLRLLEGECDAAKRNYDIYKTLSGKSRPKIEDKINMCIEAKKNKEINIIRDTVTIKERDTVTVKEKEIVYVPKQQESVSQKPKIFTTDNAYCRANKNHYIAWNIAGFGYPWNLVAGVEFRGGGIIGYGLYGDMGADFTHIKVRHSNEAIEECYTTKTTFRYAAGIKFYPYKGIFVDFGYGSIAKPVANVEYDFNTSKIGSSLNITDQRDHKQIVKKISNSHGINFHAGYNLVTELARDAGFFFGINGGLAYDVINKEVAPSFNLKIGVAWGLKTEK